MFDFIDIKSPIVPQSLCSFFRANYASDYSFSGEIHDFWEIVYVMKGRLGVTAGDQIFYLLSGDVIVHKPMEFHNLFVDDKAGASIFICSFTAQSTLRNELSRKVFSLSQEQKDIVKRLLAYLDRRREENAEYKARWERMALDGRDAYYSPYLYLFAMDPLALPVAANYIERLLLSLLESESKSRQVESRDATIFNRAMDYLDNSVSANLRMEDAAKHLNMSISSLNRIFRKYAGISLHQYYVLQRIKHADKLLRSGMSVIETAQRLGFSSQSYFSAFYKRETGKNPSEIGR